jgi:hypothetical protein
MPIARSNASISNLSGSLLLKDTKTGGSTQASLRILKALSCSLFQLNRFSFFISSVSGIAILEKFCINY